ncbi:MAG: cofactor assembly of complex C subunit B [Cyanobacteriota bacterium]|nr:cofactor assembly of complex C subunit B [Cyanobacteriota bacterium]
MNTPVLSSTFFLTLLLLVGLVFFIRASVKERIQQAQSIADLSEEALLSQLQTYFEQRAYRIAAVDAEQQQVTFQGKVRPSVFLAVFLTFLAICGVGCLALVLSFLYPTLTAVWLSLILLSPLAGWFYWRKAGRVERVLLKVERIEREPGQSPQSLMTAIAHRDELAQLQKALSLSPVPQ